MTANPNRDMPAIRFDYDKDGRMVVAVQGAKEVYRGVFDEARVVESVRQLGLSQKDRASLYLDAADRCQDDEVAERLMALAMLHAERAKRIDGMRQEFDIPLAPIGDANICVKVYADRGRNGGAAEALPPLVETLGTNQLIAITKEMREHMVHALEGTFVPYNRGEVALRAMGLLRGRVTNYVDWQQGLLQLAALTLFLRGAATFTLDCELMVDEKSLPTGSYGNGTPIVVAPKGSERHWQVMTTLFRDSQGGRLNSASLRTTAVQVDKTDGKEFGGIIYLFYPLIFDSDGQPRPNNLFKT